MKKIVLITGANGMLAKQLAKELNGEYTLRFLTRNVTQKNEYLWDLRNKFVDPKALTDLNYIIHLAGASVAEGRWTKKRKETILSSRVDSAQLLFEVLKKQRKTIDGFISASATGYYGSITSETIFNEESPKGNDFLSTVCDKWEAQALRFKSSSIAKRTAIVRIGIILSKNGGALKKMVPPIKYGIGSGIGLGNQYMPWIHIKDLCGIFKFILDTEELSGTFNGVAPEHITNTELTKEIGNTINRKILFPNIPSFIIKILFGKMAVILLEGSRVSSEKISKVGYHFKFKKANQALQHLLK
tara:strand:+ start:26833 stop:27735 length:903 start_codon:yes stop_codon:yes gene_type:complete